MTYLEDYLPGPDKLSRHSLGEGGRDWAIKVFLIWIVIQWRGLPPLYRGFQLLDAPPDLFG